MQSRADPSAYEDLLVAVLTANEAGDAAAVADLLASHPGHERALRAALSRLDRAGILHPPADGPPYPESIGGFRLLKRIGEGGMGLVFLAEQQSDRKKVAIKLVRPELLRSKVARERFHREVETIARVRHPNIVPVTAVGEEGGIPYFAMEYVAGCSLAEIVLSVGDRVAAELTGEDFARAVGEPIGAGPRTSWPAPTWWMTAAEAIAAVADAVAHVHARGILHRDLKPSNIMMTAQGRALLLDFGLAHVGVERRLTRTGLEIGSLSYMSPEQVRGEALDERTDVYSLGVTLYQLLGIALPFTGAHDEAVRASILRGVSRPLRKHNPSVPSQLELVVATAMDVDRFRRYPSMAAMMADLRAVCSGRPIAARRIGPAVRTIRWGARHPFACGALAVTVALGLVMPLFVIWIQHERQLGLQEAHDVATADLEQARSVIDLMGRHTAELAEIRDPVADQLRSRMVDETIAFYEQLRARHPGDDGIRRTLADSLRTRGMIAWQTGRLDQAEAALASAATLLEQDAEPDHVDRLMGSAQTARLQARVAMERGSWNAAELAIDRMVALLDRLIRRDPDHLDARLALAESFNIRSHVRGNQGRPAEKLALLRRALAAKRELASLSDDDRVRSSLAMQCLNLGDTLSGLPDETQAAVARYREALSLLDSLSAPQKDSAETRGLRAEAWIGLGGVLLATGDHAGSAAALASGLTLQRELCEQNPARIHNHHELARGLCTQARLLLASSAREAAAETATAAIAAARFGLQLMPDNEAVRGLLQLAHELREQAGR